MVFFFKLPSRAEVDQFIAKQQSLSFTYTAIGATAHDSRPAGYVVDHHRVKLGSGAETWARAKEAIRTWQMFNFSWLQLCWPDAKIEVGSTVGVMAKVFGLCSLNACRIVYILDQQSSSDGVLKFGFAYGTLPEHAESGEERFTVELDLATQTVTYDVLAFSKPNQFLSKLGYPFARRLQKKFAADSMAAMLRATQT